MPNSPTISVRDHLVAIPAVVVQTNAREDREVAGDLEEIRGHLGEQHIGDVVANGRGLGRGHDRRCGKEAPDRRSTLNGLAPF